MSEACVAQWLEQSADNRKTWTQIPSQSKASLFHRKFLNSLDLNNNYIQYYYSIVILILYNYIYY